MSEMAERFRKVARGFTDRAEAVPDGAWDNPTPCEGWVARDIVRHLVDWMPGFFLRSAGLELTTGPSADHDPAGHGAHSAMRSKPPSTTPRSQPASTTARRDP
jgi:hypothetical protein